MAAPRPAPPRAAPRTLSPELAVSAPLPLRSRAAVLRSARSEPRQPQVRPAGEREVQAPGEGGAGPAGAAREGEGWGGGKTPRGEELALLEGVDPGC